MTVEKWDAVEGTVLAAAGLIRGLGEFIVGQTVEAGRDVRSRLERRRHMQQVSIGHITLGAAESELHPSSPDIIYATHQA